MCSSSFLLCSSSSSSSSSSSTVLILQLLFFFFIIPQHYHHHHHLHVMVMCAPAAILPPKHNNVTDRSSLLLFKSKISLGPSHGLLLATWNDTLPFCRWPGVLCGRRHPERVVSLNLTSLDLVGTISPHLANLTFLRTIDFSSNHFHGPIPQELSRLSHLQYLDISCNSLSGIIPSEISHCLGLQTINMSYNMLGGYIPTEFGSLPSLHHLDLKNNSIIGQIPASLGNASSLSYLSLGGNLLSGGIPPSIECGMTNKVSTHGDVYSYGILLMELFTGKRPTDGAFKEGLTLRTFVNDGFSDGDMSIMDERLLANGVQASDHDQTINHTKTFECVSLVLRVGLLCTNDLPTERMEIERARNELDRIKNIFFER